MYITNVQYRTKGKPYNEYPLEIGVFPLQTKDIPHNQLWTASLCKVGCSLYGRNGGCPPLAPNFTALSAKHDSALVFYIKLNTQDYPPKSLTGKHYVRWNFTETFMPRIMRSLLIAVVDEIGGVMLSCGHCIGCRKCGWKNGTNSCLNPKQRTFSLEATGIDVEKLMRENTDLPVLWWNQNNSQYIPQYQLRVGMILTNNSPTEPDIRIIRIIRELFIT